MKENKRILTTKKLLREGLLRLLATQNLEEISISELCRTAGVNRATFYHHYTAPSDLLREMESEFVQGLRDGIKKPTSVEEARQMLEFICTRLYENAAIIRVLFRCKSDGNFLSLLNDFHANLLEIQDDIEKLKRLDRDSLRLTATYLGSGSYFLIRQWLMEDISKTPQEVASLAYTLLVAPALLG